MISFKLICFASFKVGHFINNSLNLNVSAVADRTGGVPTSICRGRCAACIDTTVVPFAHDPGDIYILGIFSFHNLKKDDPLLCGEPRNTTSDFLSLEVFLHAVRLLREATAINFGAIAIDDCYSFVHVNYMTSVFFSKDVLFVDPITGAAIDPNKVVAVVGPYSSGVAVTTAHTFSSMGIPVISYSASSVDLDDRINYPYFLRTVPSDLDQASAMVEIIKEMGWQYVSLAYVNTNYGSKGKETFLRLAKDAGICVADPLVVIPETGPLDTIGRQLTLNGAKVIVYFGTGHQIVDLMEIMNKQNYKDFVFLSSEDWDNPQILDRAGNDVKGSIIISVGTSTSVDSTFVDYLREKRISTSKENPWFVNLWQLMFECDPPNWFDNKYSQICNPDQTFSKTEIDLFSKNQRVVHTFLATMATGYGLLAAENVLCKFNEQIPCVDLLKSNPDLVWTKIRTVSVPTDHGDVRPFDQQGNGLVDFRILNIQSVDTSYEYIEVNICLCS